MLVQLYTFICIYDNVNLALTIFYNAGLHFSCSQRNSTKNVQNCHARPFCRKYTSQMKYERGCSMGKGKGRLQKCRRIYKEFQSALLCLERLPTTPDQTLLNLGTEYIHNNTNASKEAGILYCFCLIIYLCTYEQIYICK